MITIPLLGTRPLFHTIRYSVSPLYELAASLHTLAQPTPPEHFIEWSQEKLAHIQIARLMKDWEYFIPLFRYGIPDTFDPYQTKGIMGVNDQYDYFVSISTEQFVRSLGPLLEAWDRHHPPAKLSEDLHEDPDYVKGRFSLFISSYWQLSFEANWEAIAPLFVREAERIHHALGNPSSIVSLLQTILPGIAYDAEIQTLACPSSGPACKAESLILYPSHYYAAEPFVTKKGTNAHLLYSFTTPSVPTKNAL